MRRRLRAHGCVVAAVGVPEQDVWRDAVCDESLAGARADSRIRQLPRARGFHRLQTPRLHRGLPTCCSDLWLRSSFAWLQIRAANLSKDCSYGNELMRGNISSTNQHKVPLMCLRSLCILFSFELYRGSVAAAVAPARNACGGGRWSRCGTTRTALRTRPRRPWTMCLSAAWRTLSRSAACHTERARVWVRMNLGASWTTN